MKNPLPPQQRNLRRNQKVWALRILRLVKLRALSVDDPDAARAFAIVGFKQAAEIVNGGPKPRRPQSRRADAMDRRLAGSFESSRRH
jgi:hypothetical protein